MLFGGGGFLEFFAAFGSAFLNAFADLFAIDVEVNIAFTIHIEIDARRFARRPNLHIDIAVAGLDLGAGRRWIYGSLLLRDCIGRGPVHRVFTSRQTQQTSKQQR